MIEAIIEQTSSCTDRQIVEHLCAALGLARATFYRLRDEVPTTPHDMELRDAIQHIALVWSCYGYRRITA